MIFSLNYYSSIIEKALHKGYKFYTLKEFVDCSCPSEKAFILRHDLDQKPETLNRMLNVERHFNVRSTIFIRVTGEYNPFWYDTFQTLTLAEKDGFELGLHTNFLEFSAINNDFNYPHRAESSASSVLKSELTILRQFFSISGIACHRDVNYIYNSLPFLECKWEQFKDDFSLSYQAYDKSILSSTTYVNEGLNPRLCWRNHKPEDVIDSGNSIYMLTHNHWWHRNHPFDTK